MHQVIATQSVDEADISAEAARALYTDMVRARRFDERAISLQRRGWMSSYPGYRGQEASQIGAVHALTDDDWLFPTYRANAMQFARGVPMSDILLFRRGHAEFTSGHDSPIFPQAVPIATQIPHAVGAAMAADYKRQDHIACCYFGDGATSEGDFHEGLNFAGVFDAPVVFFCENNGWAISLPTHRQTASTTIAQKADAYGFEGVRVDGNDPVAVMETVIKARESARRGEPVLIESLTYRQGAHSTSDDPERYESQQLELPDWRTEDPVARYERWLKAGGVLDDERVTAIETNVEEELDRAVAQAEETPRPDPDRLFERVYGEMTPRLRAQRERVRSHTARHGHPESHY